MRIPEVRDRLREMAELYLMPELAELADELKRRPPVRKAPPKSSKMTEDLRHEIRVYAADHPTATYTEIGRRYDVGIGRVSEALSGFRE